MDSIFKIFTKHCDISIIGLESEFDEYAYEDIVDPSPSFRQYKWSESVTINVIQSVTSEDEYTTEFVDYVIHDTRADRSDFIFEKDGLYQISHIILPTKSFIESAIEGDNLLDMYSVIYYFNEETELLYKYIDGVNDKEISLDEILEINPENTTIIKSNKQTFCTCYIEKCLYDLIKNDIKSNWNRCNKKTSTNYNRDLLWMSLYIIKYLIELNQNYEAQRILETLLDCGNLCQHVINKSNGRGCNCN